MTATTAPREIFCLESEWNGVPRLLTALNAEGGFLMLVNEDDVSAQSVVLSPYEVRWLAHNFFGDPDRVPVWRYWWANVVWRFRRGR